MNNKFMKSLCLSIAGVLTIGSLSLTTPVTAMAGTTTVTRVTTTTTTTSNGSSMVRSIQTASDMTVAVRSRTQICVSVSPANAANKSVRFSSSDDNILTVSKTGVIRAKQRGHAVVTVSSRDGNKSKRIKVTVRRGLRPVASINPVIRSRFMKIGDQFQIATNVMPANATNKNVYYTTTNPGVATVSKTGVIKGISKGEAVIYVHSSDSGAASVHFRIEVGSTVSNFFGNIFQK